MMKPLVYWAEHDRVHGRVCDHARGHAYDHVPNDHDRVLNGRAPASHPFELVGM